MQRLKYNIWTPREARPKFSAKPIAIAERNIAKSNQCKLQKFSVQSVVLQKSFGKNVTIALSIFANSGIIMEI